MTYNCRVLYFLYFNPMNKSVWLRFLRSSVAFSGAEINVKINKINKIIKLNIKTIFKYSVDWVTFIFCT